MPLEFLRTNLRFQERSRSVQLAALCDGVLMDVIVPRRMLEHLASAQRLTQDESFTTVIQNKELLRLAAARAAARRGAHVPIITVQVSDLLPDDPPTQPLRRITAISEAELG